MTNLIHLEKKINPEEIIQLTSNINSTIEIFCFLKNE